jgi:subtilisin family serine protease
MTQHTRTREHDDDCDESTTTRRSYMAGLGTGLAAAVSPLTVAWPWSDPGSLSELAATYDAFGGGTATEIAIEHGNARHPSWPVVYEAGKRNSLETWLTESDDRELLAEHQPSRAATVIAPPGDIRSLAANGWIEGVDINFEASYADPVDNLAERVENNGLGLTSFQRRLVGVLSDLPTTAGLATDTDAEAVTPAQVRQILTADTEAVTSLDTSTVTVAVVDTGFNAGSGDILGDRPSDADYSPRLLPESKSMISGETVADNGLSAIEDGAGHGSFVASQILGNPSDADYQGLLPNANLLAVKALGDDGGGTMADIANGIRYAAEQGADVICMSLGSPQYGTDIAAALEYATQEGSIPVAATGNDRQATRWVATPASSEDAIGVGATTGDPPAEAQSAYFSNIGPHPGTTDLSAGATNGATPAIAAPGMKIKAKVGQPNGSTTIETLSGTSMAAPLVAGVVGLLLASDSSLKGEFDDVRSRLRDHARPIPAAGTTEVGAGMVDANAAITEAETADQSDEMTDEAFSRNEAYNALSNQQGGLFARFLA